MSSSSYPVVLSNFLENSKLESSAIIISAVTPIMQLFLTCPPNEFPSLLEILMCK